MTSGDAGLAQQSDSPSKMSPPEAPNNGAAAAAAAAGGMSFRRYERTSHTQ